MMSRHCGTRGHVRIKYWVPITSRSLSYRTVHRIRPADHGTPKAVRHVSTSASLSGRLSNMVYGSIALVGASSLYLYLTDTRASVHTWLVIPIFQMLYTDAEEAHHVGNAALKALWHLGLYPRERGSIDATKDLRIDLFGYDLVNPIATSAGLDKGADIPDALFSIGPSIVEVGGATPLAQGGNAKPRVFRLPSQNALINRYGLNSQGAAHMACILRDRVRHFAKSRSLGYDAEAERYVLDGHACVPPGSLTPGRLLAINIAKNKHTPDQDVDQVKQDYVYCVQKLGPYADILVVNVSSPNTPGLRSLQQSKPLTQILRAVVEAAQNVDRKKKPAVMVKVSPDEDSNDEITSICHAVWDSGVDGVIVGNTTTKRPNPLPAGYRLSPTEAQVAMEHGGYSGPQLFDQTLSLVRKYQKLLHIRPQQALKSKNNTTAEPCRDISQHSSPNQPPEKVDRIQASVPSRRIDFQDSPDRLSSEKQPLSQPPTERKYRSDLSMMDSAPPIGTRLVSKAGEPKVIFATGGITNGRQALEVLNAGASIAMVYTALVYGGVGTISRIKNEMRTEREKEDSSTMRE